MDTTHEAVDWVNTLLAETDYADEVNIAAYLKPDFPQLLERSAEPDWAFTIRLYLPYDARVNARTEKIDRLLSPLHRTGLTTALQKVVVEQKLAYSEMNARIHRIGQRFVVLTPDATYRPEAAEITLSLKPTLSFGSGLHPATIVSLQLLERYVTPTMKVLDLGSGSGILSVAMAKLGAEVLALDNDRMAVEATQDAVIRNGVEQQVVVRAGSLGSGSDLGHWMSGNLTDVPMIEPTATFDLIVANILARVQVALADDFQCALRQTDAQTDVQTGILITSGFTIDHEDEVHTALVVAGFEAVDCARSNEWVALVHRLIT